MMRNAQMLRSSLEESKVDTTHLWSMHRAGKSSVAGTCVQVGDDANAQMLRSSLEGSRVDTSHLRSVDGPSGTAVVLLQPSGLDTFKSR